MTSINFHTSSLPRSSKIRSAILVASIRNTVLNVPRKCTSKGEKLQIVTQSLLSSSTSARITKITFSVPTSNVFVQAFAHLLFKKRAELNQFLKSSTSTLNSAVSLDLDKRVHALNNAITSASFGDNNSSLNFKVFDKLGTVGRDDSALSLPEIKLQMGKMLQDSRNANVIDSVRCNKICNGIIQNTSKDQKQS